jgi:hypothetical protein
MDEPIVLKVNGEIVEINSFVKNIMTDVNKAIIDNLKIGDKDIKSIEIKISA